jgi:exodeoxyribonuclease VII large subunit
MQEVAAKRRALDTAFGSLRERQPRHRVAAERARLDATRRRLRAAATRIVELQRPALDGRTARLQALSPRRTLERGYSITLDGEGHVVTGSDDVRAGQRLRTLLHRGALESEVTDVEPAT